MSELKDDSAESNEDSKKKSKDPQTQSVFEASKKCELEELKEKIMKLEQRNFELERKLSSNNVLNNPSSQASKENSFNDSSFTNAESANNESLTKSATPVFAPTATAKPSFQQTLNTIPNINQGGFIITSNGSIAYVPPSSLQNIQSTPKPVVNEDKPAEVEPIKLDFDSTKNSNLDLGSFLGKSLFNPASANSSSSSAKSAQASPVKNSPSSSTLASSSAPTTNKQPAQAYILSNGQLVPVNPAPASLSPVVPIQPKQLAPLLPLQPKTAVTSTPVVAAKTIKPKKTKAKPKPAPQNEPIQLDLSSLLVPAAPSPTLLPIKPATTTPVVTTTSQPAILNGKIAIAPLSSSSAGKKPREIRPKPSSNTSSTTKLQIKPVSLAPATTTTSLVINPVMESNDILAKAASMIFSPSEFNSLNTLSPNTAPSTTILNQAISLSPSGGGGEVFTPVANIQPKPAKVAIQRYSSQNSLPTTSKLKNLKPLATSVSNSNLAAKTTPTEANKKTVKPKPAGANSAKLLLPANKSSSSQNLKPLLPNTALASTTTDTAANTNSTTGNINLIDFQKFNETSLVSMCDLEAFSQSLLFSSSSSIIVANAGSLEKSSAPPVEIQSILNKCVITPSKTTAASEEEDSKKATVKPKERSKSPEIMSMPSLEQFFEIELGSCANSSAEDASKHKSPQAIKPKPNTTKKLMPSPTTPNKKIKEILKPDAKASAKPKQEQSETGKKKLPVLKPNTNSPVKEIRISPKISPAKTDAEQKPKAKLKPKEKSEPSLPEKIKFEFSDLDKVLDQVESLEAKPQAKAELKPAKANGSDEFLFDLNIENSSPNSSSSELHSPSNAFKLNSFTLGSAQKKLDSTKAKHQQTAKLKTNADKLNKSSVLCTPPSLVASTAKKLKANKQTPVKTVKSDELPEPHDLFSLMNKQEEAEAEIKQQRTPLKPDNHQQQICSSKKRGRPPKPAVSKQLENNFDSSTEDIGKKNKTTNPKSNKEDESKSNLSSGGEDDEENSNLLNDAVANTFQELIFDAPASKPVIDSLKCSKHKSEQNSEHEAEDNFEYDLIEPNEKPDDECTFDINRILTDDDANNHSQNQELTIASLTLSKRKRTRSNNKTSNNTVVGGSKTSKSGQETKANAKTDNVKCKRRRNTQTSVYDDENELETNEENGNEESSGSGNENDDLENSNSESGSSKLNQAGNEKRKRGRGRPPKQTSTGGDSNKEIGEFFTNKTKPPNKKVSNSQAGASSAPSIEYAGLTRFEIPIPFDLNSEQLETKADECSENKIPKLDEEVKIEEKKLNEDNLADVNMLDLAQLNTNINEVVGEDQSEHLVDSIENVQPILGNEPAYEQLEAEEKSAAAVLPQAEFSQDEEEDDEESEAEYEQNYSSNNVILDNADGYSSSYNTANGLYEKAEAKINSHEQPKASFYANNSNNNNNTDSSNEQNMFGFDNNQSNTSNANNANYWGYTNQNGTEHNSNPAHLTHFDLENDPILNNDLQQLHNNPASIQPQHQLVKSTNLIITPPSTVSSVSSSSSIASNQANNNNKSTGSTSLSINPSSTSSNASSTQMISPVSITSTGADNPAPNSNIRSSSVDTSHHYNAANNTSYYNSTSANNMQYYSSGSNPAQSNYPVYANQPNVSYGSSSNLNLSIQQPPAGLNRSNNSSPQLMYSAASSATTRSHSVAPNGGVTPAPAQSNLNTSQSPHNANKLSTTPTPTTPTPASSSSYNTSAGYNTSQIASSSSTAPAPASSKPKPSTTGVKSQQFQSIESLSSYNQTPNVTFGQRFDPMAALSALSTPGFSSSDVAGFNGLNNPPSQFSSTQYSSAQYYNQALTNPHSSYLPPLPNVGSMNHYKVNPGLNFHSDLMLQNNSVDTAAKKSSKEPAAPTTPKKSSSKSTKKSKSSAQSTIAQPAAPTLHNQLSSAHFNSNWYNKNEPLGWNSKVALPNPALPLPAQPSRQYAAGASQNLTQTQLQANHYAAQYGQLKNESLLSNTFFPKPNELSSAPAIQQQHQSRLYQHQYEANNGGLLSNSSNYIKVNSSQPAQAQQAHRAAASSSASGAPTISYTHGANQISSQQQQQQQQQRVLNANPQDSLFAMRNATHSNLYQQQHKQQQQHHQNYQNQIGQHQQVASAHPGNQQHQQYQTANSFSTYPNQFSHVNPNTAYLNSANYQTFAHQLNQPIGAAAAAVAAITQNGLLGNQFPTHLNWTSNLN